MSNRIVRPFALGAMLLAFTACSDSRSIVGPDAEPVLGRAEHPGTSQSTHGSESAQPALLVCPSAVSYTASATIGREGGSLSAGGTTITLPSGAVKIPTVFTLTVPASDFVEVDIVAGNNEHFSFDKRVGITIDYSRCGILDADKPLTAWHINSTTKALIKQMGSRTDRTGTRVSFGTDHLSGYALAW